MAYPLVEIVAAELNSRVWHNADAVSSVASHESSPAFLAPHLSQRLTDRHFIRISADALNLHKNLQALKGGDNRS